LNSASAWPCIFASHLASSSTSTFSPLIFRTVSGSYMPAIVRCPHSPTMAGWTSSDCGARAPATRRAPEGTELASPHNRRPGPARPDLAQTNRQCAGRTVWASRREHHGRAG
jgi:hypothetical protein